MTDQNALRGAQVVSTSVVFVVIAKIAVALRLITRLWIAYSIGPEDWLIVIAGISPGFYALTRTCLANADGHQCCSIVVTALIGEEVRYCTERHLSSIPDGEYARALKPLFASIPVYNAALTLTKCSILLQYLGLFPDTRTRRTCWVVIAFVATYGITAIILSIFICQPVSYYWDKTIAGHCLDDTSVYFSNASFNIVSDLVILIIPIPIVKSLQLPKRQKVGLILIFGIGAFAWVTSILRLNYLYIFSTSTDPTWDNAGVATWSSVETNVGIICACLPTLKPLFVRFVPRLLGSSRSRNRENGTISSGMHWSRRTRHTALSSKSVSRMGAIPLSEQSREQRHDVEYGYAVRGATESHDENHSGNEGQIKVVQVIHVEHEHMRRDTASTDRSEVDLIYGK